MVLKEPRCAAPQVMLARLFGQNGERKVQEMNARLRALTNSKKQRMVMKNFISETTEASRMRKQREALKVGGMERSILSDVRSTVRLLCIVCTQITSLTIEHTHTQVRNLKEKLQVPESEVAAKRRIARQESETSGDGVGLSMLFGGEENY